jgi:CHAD domain-containing protein
MTTTRNEETSAETGRLLLDALENRWKRYRTDLKRCRDEFSNEAVHDLRVAARRMLAIIELLNALSPRPRPKKLTRAFKDQLDEFNELRDTQVMLAELSEILQGLPQLYGFQKHLQFTEARLLRNLRKRIKGLESSEVSKRILKTHEYIEKGAYRDSRPQIIQAVDDVYLIIRQRLDWVNPSRSVTIHRMRISFKSFRYMVEIIHPLLENYPVENLKLMNDYQVLMGEIQDAEVFAQTLADYSEHASFADPESVRHYYELRHAEAVSTYAEAMNQIHAFWRSAPEEPFPWEKTK